MLTSLIRRHGQIAVLLGLLLAGCSDEDGSARTAPTARKFEENRAARASANASVIDVADMPTNPRVAGQIVYMPFAEAAARLDSLTFEARSNFIFSRGTEDVEQTNVMQVALDANGNFHAVLNGGPNSVEFYRVGEEAFVRQDKGTLRRKPQREVAFGTWCELAWSVTSQGFELFQPRLRFRDGRPESVAGRQTLRFDLALAAPNDTSFVISNPPPSPIALAVPTKWRELARPLAVSGSVWVDTATGVVVKTRLEGRLEIADRSIRPTQLSVRVETDTTSIGSTAAIVVPASAPEFVRDPISIDPLAFFKGELEKAGALEHSEN